jgi:2,4-dienoyl-CoA reductase (NADPH2)
VVIFEASPRIGGQLDLARYVPGKEGFRALLDYYESELIALQVDVRLGTQLDSAGFATDSFDRVIIATGVRPRRPEIPGIAHSKVAYYPQVLTGEIVAGRSVAIIGTGAIAYDVAEFLTAPPVAALSANTFYERWGVDRSGKAAGGVIPPRPEKRFHELYLLQRTDGRPAAHLGISTAWILRTTLKRNGASFLTGCNYDLIDDEGLHYTTGGTRHTLKVDNVVICAGQVAQRGLLDYCKAKSIPFDVIGGARDESRLDAERAIAEGYQLGLEC